MTCRKCKRETPSDALYCPYCGVSLNPTKSPHKTRTRPNGAGTAYRRGKSWYAQVTVGWKDVDGKAVAVRRTKGGFTTKKSALDYCQELLKTPRQLKKQTMLQIYEAWLVVHENRVGKSTMNCYKAAWKFFAPLHYVPFSDIELDDLQECMDDCPNGKRTLENMKALAGLLYKYAIPRHQAELNLAEYLNTGNGRKSTHPAFTHEQVERIQQSVDVVPHADILYCLIYTGFRPTEMFSLTKEDYKDGILYGGIKTTAGKNRAVPVSPRILPIIERRLQSDSPYLFPKDDGTFLTANYYRKFYFYQTLDAIGIQSMDNKDNPTSLVPYSARHTFANLLKNAPGSDKDKAGLIGHEDYKTTKKHYQSAELDALKIIIESL